jgi:hypothetical protein
MASQAGMMSAPDLQELVDGLVGHVGGLHRVGDQVHGQEQPDDLLERPEEHPAGSGQDHRGPPAPRVLRCAGRHEPQVVDLLGDLRDQRQAHARGQHHRAEAGRTLPGLALVGEELAHRLRVTDHQVAERRDHQHQPQRSRPQLQFRQQ